MSTPPEMIDLSGKHLEGGGQVVRLAVSLAALTRTSIHIDQIRGNRPAGGLKTQHLRAVLWLGEASNSRMVGAEKGSKDLIFQPGQLDDAVASTAGPSTETKCTRAQFQDIKIDVGSPGSIGLVLQAVLPYILFSAKTEEPLPVRLTISGGTNVSFSPSYDYILHVLVPTLSRIGFSPISVGLNKRGWTHGGSSIGSIWLSLQPLPAKSTLSAFTLTERGRVEKFSLVMLAPDAATRQRLQHSTTAQLLHIFPDTQVEVVTSSDSWNPKRFYLLLVAHTSGKFRLGRDWLYDRKIKDYGETVDILAKRVVCEMEVELSHGGCVDEYMQDQLVIFQSLAKGKSVVDTGQQKDLGEHGSEETSATSPPKASLHTRTARWVAETILGVEFDEHGNCEGIGLTVG